MSPRLKSPTIKISPSMLLHRLFISSDKYISFSQELSGLLYTLHTVKYTSSAPLSLTMTYYLNNESTEISDDSSLLSTYNNPCRERLEISLQYSK